MTDSPLAKLPPGARSTAESLIDSARSACSDSIEVVLLGSHARGDADPESDLDLLFVADFTPGVDRRSRLGVPPAWPPPTEGVRVDALCLTPRELEAILIVNSIESQVMTQALPRAIVLHAFAEGVPIGECPQFCAVRERYRDEVRTGRLPEVRPPIRVPTVEHQGIPNVVALIDETRKLLSRGHPMQNDSARRKCAAIAERGQKLPTPWSHRRTYAVLTHLASPWRTRLPPFIGVGSLGNAFGDPPVGMRYTEIGISPLIEQTAEVVQAPAEPRRTSRAEVAGVIAELQKLADDEPNPTMAKFHQTVRNALHPDQVIEKARREAVPTSREESWRRIAESKRTVPLLLVNGTIGLPGARATFLPHDLGGVADALLALLDDPSTTDEQILDRVGLPDFPTGGVLPDPAGARAAQRDGTGIVRWEPSVAVRGSGDDRVLVLSGIPIDVTIRTIISELEALRDAGTLAARSIEGIAHGSHASIEVHLPAEADASAIAGAAIDGSSLSWEIEVDMTALDGGTEFRAGVPFWVRKHYEARRAFHPNEASLREEFRELRALGDARRTVCATD